MGTERQTDGRMRETATGKQGEVEEVRPGPSSPNQVSWRPFLTAECRGQRGTPEGKEKVWLRLPG